MSIFSWFASLFKGSAPQIAPESRQLPSPSYGDYAETVRVVMVQPGQDIQNSVDYAIGKTPPKGEVPDIPISLFQNWSIQSAKAAVNAFMEGMFGNAAMLVEAMLGDDRIQSAVNGRVKGITKCQASFEPVEGYEEVAQDLESVWPQIFSEEIIEQIWNWVIFMRFCICELIWEVDPDSDKWVPRIKAWHPYYTYYNIVTRKYVVITMEGNIEIDESDPKWFVFGPWGSYRGWIGGAVRSVWQPWLVRQLALRDWCRSNEQFGIPLKVIKVPSQSDSQDKARTLAAVNNLGSSTTLILPQQGGADGEDTTVELLESNPTAWKTFPGLIDQCDKSITLAIRGTNLTTEVNGGSHAAAKTHREEDSDYATADRLKFASAVQRLVRLYCGYNYGRTDIAPKFAFVSPEVDKQDAATLLKSIGEGVIQLKTAGFNPDLSALAEQYGLAVLPDAKPTDEDTSALTLKPEDIASVVTVNEARASTKLGPLQLPTGGDDPDGHMTLEQYRAKQAGTTASAINPEEPTKPTLPAPPP